MKKSEKRTMNSKTRLFSHSPTKCRGFYHFFYNSIGFLLFFFSLSVFSATPEQIEQIQRAAESHVINTVDKPIGGELVVNAANIDPRIFATDCPNELQTSSSSHSGSASNITVLVECPADNWRIYVPVRLTMTVPMVTALNALSRGQTITQNDITLSMVDLLRFRRQGFSSQDMVIGAKTKRNLQLGDVINRNDICVVCRNESVLIRAVSNGMNITTRGTALSDGNLGEQIKVKNDRSNRIIDAQVSGMGEVTVQF
ncbi:MULTISPECIES: flagellar basal body P-ring formation chaperone FlgA [Vibrio]|jgi:flagella basal body P-ring formation protein FlgA|uniref:Flagellar basal body P-ring formation protein FlgA n=5 Tax=Unclassified Bacteria TaxID=49928 RepID=A0AAU6SVI9_UNCXX|nr:MULTISPECIES: flagellar basal body P-ring formation chaperone FlgA [Vibrio]EKO3557325.1 flagellar basal body P-ring formation protein FlgA [Vibrio metschnikovii]EKO3569321.1 flagellar basal body P-ring formation protein FlgA [Vibrio metschnikovii]EKO3571907.1 flagellar basal body P-ring formation protein FlgA [Vibrio metschnikovii]EKO3576441.1 flagellar basal body P-ring formation protein FlgA [Vibrio metschnikovii]EKO3578955.1 flagellar basal body P-ring formation protein FlgA [Vibrio mets